MVPSHFRLHRNVAAVAGTRSHDLHLCKPTHNSRYRLPRQLTADMMTRLCFSITCFGAALTVLSCSELLISISREEKTIRRNYNLSLEPAVRGADLYVASVLDDHQCSMRVVGLVISTRMV